MTTTARATHRLSRGAAGADCGDVDAAVALKLGGSLDRIDRSDQSLVKGNAEAGWLHHCFVAPRHFYGPLKNPNP
uniref:Uncharacterized protein n=1 Tax=Leersia perrieri TaxID=77586 RepID=A0A0D9XI77_9ORYZ